MIKKFIFLLLLIAITIFFVPTLNTAFIIGTGLGLNSIQSRVNQIADKAIHGKPISSEDKEWFRHLYGTMAWGASLTVVLPRYYRLTESARLMKHFLEGSGEATYIDVDLFKGNHRIIKQQKGLRSKLKKVCDSGKKFSTAPHDFGGYDLMDAHFALYFGILTGERISDERIVWTVSMPWDWPDYNDLRKSYGKSFDKKEIFPIPNMLSIIKRGRPLMLPNGLGGELENWNLAKAFDTETRWTETLSCS